MHWSVTPINVRMIDDMKYTKVKGSFTVQTSCALTKQEIKVVSVRLWPEVFRHCRESRRHVWS